MGGVPADRLAREYGTPLLVIDLDQVDTAIAKTIEAAESVNADVSYAAKAFATIEFVRHLASRAIGLDVCSLGELVTAERAGFPADRMTLHGAGKSDEELRAACRGRVGSIVVDGIAELDTLAAAAHEGCRAGVLLRLNLGVEAQTHAFVRTAGTGTKFGISSRDETRALATLSANPQLSFTGLHVHLGSQIFQEKPYVSAAERLVEAAQRFAVAGRPPRRLVIGGGFGVRTHPDEPQSLDVAATLRAVRNHLGTGSHDSGFAQVRLGIEPGRAIVAEAGTTLYRVLAVKHQLQRTFVIVDGGMAENPRPALYGARHHVIAVAHSSGDGEEMTLCGRSCENDELGSVRLPRGLGVGELLAMLGTGAYTFSMAGNYNRFPRPAVLGVSENSKRLLAHRETLDDVLRNDTDLKAGVDASARSRPAF